MNHQKLKNKQSNKIRRGKNQIHKKYLEKTNFLEKVFFYKDFEFFFLYKKLNKIVKKLILH